MNKTVYLPIYLLSASLVFFGVTSPSQAEGASTITQLEKRIKVLEEKNQSLNLTSKVLVKWVKELRGCFVPVTVTETNPGVATGVANLAFCIKE
jgi:hypothetical protein